MLTSANGVLRTSDPIEGLEERATAETGAVHFVRTQDGYQPLPVVMLEIDRLVYRADNGRILSEIRQACHAQGLVDDDGRIAESDARVQAILHDLLVAKASDESSPILAELRQHAVQTEPLLITRRGLVVNGNRRLASMRELLRRDAERYAGFGTLACALLPDSFSHETIEFIEANLQMAPDLKLGYGWINRRLKLREHVTDLPRDMIVDAYRLRDESQIDVELAELALAEDYLVHRGAPGDFGQIGEMEEPFAAFNQQLAILKNPHLHDLWKLAGFAMIAASDQLPQPLDHTFPFTPPRPPAIPNWVMRAYAADRGVAEPVPSGENEPLAPRTVERLRPLLADPAEAQAIARHIGALIDTLKGNESELLAATRVLNNLRSFRKTLENQGLSLLDERQHRQIRAEITALTALLEGDGAKSRAAAHGSPASEKDQSVGSRLGRLIRPR